MKRKTRLFILINIFILVFSTISYAQQPLRVLLNMNGKDIERAYWIVDGKTFGVKSTGKLAVFDTNGKLKWQIKENFVYEGYSSIRVITTDDKLKSFSFDGKTEWIKSFPGGNISYFEGMDGTFVVTEEQESKMNVNVFSQKAQLLWKIKTEPFITLSVLPNGKGVLGLKNSEKDSKLVFLDAKGNNKLLKTITDPYIYSGEGMIYSYTNLTTRQILLIDFSSDYPWWALISENGEIINQQNKMPVEGADMVTPFGNGFAFTYSKGGAIAMIVNKKTIWTTTKFPYTDTQHNISGNKDFLAYTDGDKVYLYNNQGKLLNNININININFKLSLLDIAKSKPIIIGSSDDDKILIIGY